MSSAKHKPHVLLYKNYFRDVLKLSRLLWVFTLAVLHKNYKLPRPLLFICQFYDHCGDLVEDLHTIWRSKLQFPFQNYQAHFP